MSIFIFTYVAIGLFYGMYITTFLKNSSLLDIAVHQLIKDLNDSKVRIDATPRKVENMLIVSITLISVVAWPIIMIRRM